MSDYRIEELMVSRIAADVPNYGVTVLGSFTPLAYAAYMLAKLTHAPDNWLVGFNAVGMRPIQLSLAGAEASVYRGASGRWSFSQTTETVHLGRRGLVECISPAQIDGSGAFNVSVIGDYDRPKVRLPGGAGSPEVIQHYKRIILYVSRHDRRTLVDRVDFRTGMRKPIDPSARASRGLLGGPIRLLTPLAMLIKDSDDSPFRIESLHPGVELDTVVENTGFELDTEGPTRETQPPTPEELRLLREQIDPMRTIRVDFMDARSRRSFVREVLGQEASAALAKGPSRAPAT